ncbi:MAG: adenylate/guanylate cyclase domain-containing protein, partial [Gaiella sp.]
MPVCAGCGFESERAFRFCPDCGAEQAPGSPSHEQRRTVTVVFCDLAGSTALGESVDPERLRRLLADYFERMKAIVESHGGSVEKFIGDAVMAVFGVPATHEDDALRAVRAAAEMRAALPELGLAGRIGVMTGEVVTGTAERLVTGDAVNVAARLEQAAAAGEVLIGEPTLDLARAAVEVEAVGPLELKGKSAPVAAFRLLDVHDAPERHHDTPFVGRDRELALVRSSWQRVIDERRCGLVTIVGEAGIGKSRLIAEAIASIDGSVVRARCLPYGHGITYWPVVEVLKQLDRRPPEPAAAAAIDVLLGESDVPTSPDEISWAVRRTLEHAARARPLLVAVDDIQWAEQGLLDVIEHVALLSTDSPILLVCMARPELVERHPAWPVALRLAPLREDAVEALIGDQLVNELRHRIAQAAGGNPLFVNEMLAMNAHASGEVVVPPTLSALLAARLDQLDPSERTLLEHASVEGETFHRGALQALSRSDAPITPLLASLARKQLIRPARSLIPGDDGFRFHHLLLRDAAYHALAKTTRAELHAAYGGWLEQRGGELVELDEVAGHHLHQACAYRAELGV